MTFSIINKTTNKVISRFNFSPAGEPTSPNLRIDSLTAPSVVAHSHLTSNYLEDHEKAPDAIKDEAPNASIISPNHKIPIIDPNEVVGRSFLIPQEDCQRL